MDGLGMRGGKKGIKEKNNNQDEFYPVFFNTTIGKGRGLSTGLQ